MAAAGRFLHPALDARGVDDAVFDSYGWPSAMAADDAALLAVFRRNQVGPGWVVLRMNCAAE
jgi:hypothetical protein